VTSDNGINKDGAAMREVFDTATLRNDQQAFSISYMYQQAFIYNKLHPTGFQFTSEQINGDQGQPLGDDVMDGNLPGCFDASAYVYIKIRVDVPQLVVEKKVRKPGGTEWLESVDAKPGETVQWMVNVRNRGTTTQTNVISNDVVPPHLTYVNNTAKWYTVDFPNGNNYDFDQYEVNDGDGGYNFGNYGAGSNVVIRFDTTVNNDFSECQITLRNVARARSDQFPTDMEDSADVRITKENCQPNQPTYKCDVLEIQHLGGRNYHFTARASGTPGATISRYIYTFGDEAPGAQPFISDKNTVDHTYAKDGTYTATLKVEFTVNGQAQTPVTAATCSKQITAGQPVPPTPTTPGKLPNTGAGDMVALFTAVTFGAAAAHRTYLTKRYGL
jgi:uncharacterized repeat protein (TIGR01451 family)